MKRAATVFVLVMAAGLLLISCGGGGSNPNPGTSGIKERAFVSVTRPQPTGFTLTFLQIIDAAKDLEAAFTVPPASSFSSLGFNPTTMVVSTDKKNTFVIDSVGNAVYVVDNAKESVVGNIALPSWTESLVLSSDAKIGWAAVRNAPVTGAPNGAIQVLDTVNLKINTQIAVPLVHFLVLSHDGKKMLAFSDNSDSVSIVDSGTNSVVASVAGFDRPVTGFFAADDSKAYILSCGAECGGTAANVRVLDMTTNTAGASVAVPGATAGLMDGTTLYVAGTTPAGGQLDIINLNNLTVTNSTPIAISDGFHGPIALGANGKLFVGARNCTNRADVPHSGCLSIVDTAALSSVVDNAHGPVTGLQPIADRNIMYVIEGGELVIYDTTTNAPHSTQVDIVGNAFDVKTVF